MTESIKSQHEPFEALEEELRKIKAIIDELDIEPGFQRILKVQTLASAIVREAEAGTRNYLVFDDQTQQELFLANPPAATEIAFIIWLVKNDHHKYVLVCQRCSREVIPRKGEGISKRFCGVCTRTYL